MNDSRSAADPCGAIAFAVSYDPRLHSPEPLPSPAASKSMTCTRVSGAKPASTRSNESFVALSPGLNSTTATSPLARSFRQPCPAPFPAGSTWCPSNTAVAKKVQCEGGLAGPTNVTIHTDVVTHEISELAMGCHSDSGYEHQPRGFYAQM